MNQHDELIVYSNAVVNLSVNTNNYILKHSLLAINPTVDNVELTGIKLPELGLCRITVMNVHATNNLVIKHNTTSDTDARVMVNNSQDYVLAAGREITLTWVNGNWKLHTTSPNGNTVSYFHNGVFISNKNIIWGVFSETGDNTDSKSIDISAAGYTTVLGVWAITIRNSATIGNIDGIALLSEGATAVGYTLTKSGGLLSILGNTVDGTVHDNAGNNTAKFLVLGY